MDQIKLLEMQRNLTDQLLKEQEQNKQLTRDLEDSNRILSQIKDELDKAGILPGHHIVNRVQEACGH